MVPEDFYSKSKGSRRKQKSYIEKQKLIAGNRKLTAKTKSFWKTKHALHKKRLRAKTKSSRGKLTCF